MIPVSPFSSLFCCFSQRGAFVSEPAILVKSKKKGSQIWSMEKFENKIIDMRDMYQERKDKGLAMMVTDEPYVIRLVCCMPFFRVCLFCLLFRSASECHYLEQETCFQNLVLSTEVVRSRNLSLEEHDTREAKCWWGSAAALSLGIVESIKNQTALDLLYFHVILNQQILLQQFSGLCEYKAACVQNR